MFILEVINWYFWRREVQFNEPKISITVEQFEKRVGSGEKLVLLDDKVLDVGKFMWNHPGGTFLIQHNIGRDISKFFYGGYHLENGPGLKPYTHSNDARKAVNSLIIATLEEKAHVFRA